MDSSDPKIKRREFLHKGAVVAAGGAAWSSTALSYTRIAGANDRISLGHIGVGNRGSELDGIVASLKDQKNVEMTAVCDLWTHNVERAMAANQQFYGKAPRGVRHPQELLALKDVDAVLLKNLIVQIGTQHRSERYQIAVRDLVRSKVLGEATKYEIEWNYHGPRWRGRPEVKMIREQDTDWQTWLMGKPSRPFDPRLYFEFRLYKDFSSGIPDQWMSHGIDLCHFFLDEEYPASVVANGGVFAWHDGRENPDTFQALFTYSSGLLVSYATSFGNDAPSFTRIMGKNATLINHGGEGSPRWQMVEE